jgi:hypothetical protein
LPIAIYECQLILSPDANRKSAMSKPIRYKRGDTHFISEVEAYVLHGDLLSIRFLAFHNNFSLHQRFAQAVKLSAAPFLLTMSDLHLSQVGSAFSRAL